MITFKSPKNLKFTFKISCSKLAPTPPSTLGEYFVKALFQNALINFAESSAIVNVPVLCCVSALE